MRDVFAVKLLGALLVIGASGFIGQVVSQNYLARAGQLRELGSLLGVLETEISYLKTPLPEIFDRLAATNRGACASLFRETRNLLLSGEGYTAREAWEIALERSYPFTALSTEDRAILLAFGRSLGNSGSEEQVKHIRELREYLKLQEARAREEGERNARVWGYLGVGTGLLLVLLFF